MTHHRRQSLGAAIAVSLALVVPASVAFAGPPTGPAKSAPAKGQPAKGAKGAPASAADAPTVGKPIQIQPTTMAWGIDKKKLGEVYDKVIDDDYKAKYRKVQPGPEMESLDAEVTEKKAEFRRSWTEFKDVATGYDSTPLRPEYTYLNKEALMVVDRGGKVRYFFFIQGKLWKIVDVIKIGEKSKWGKTFVEAAAMAAKAYGVEGRVRDADPAQGRPFTEVDWKDATTHVRAADWGNDQVAFIFEDNATASNIAAMRPNKETSQTTIDPKVKDAGRKDGAPSPAPVEDKKPANKAKAKQ
ncbi:MAG TPA: hypothetical protein VL400_07650 [Polyangiaceae bacterium]|jgi:hypothetical protein|nr:hypothetical protein [Polyangiaceae bacterium]